MGCFLLYKSKPELQIQEMTGNLFEKIDGVFYSIYY